MDFNKRYDDPLLKRLQMEQQLLTSLVNTSDVITYTTINDKEGLPPNEYLITFKLKSIIGIDNTGYPVYGSQHQARIQLPQGYPLTSQPICKMQTDVWHPNIRSSGQFKGHICVNAQVLGTWHTLDLLVEQIGEMLQYKNYHAENIIPFPEDSEVAKWVKNFAEPNGIVDKDKGVAVDDTPLRKESQDWLKSRKKKINIMINRIKINGKVSREFEKKENTSAIRIKR